jgi:hypothetical protein
VTREEFEHTVRAAGAVLGVTDILVIGSQALHASVHDELPEEAMKSVEVDVAFPGDVDQRNADLIDGSIGESSMFHATFGYYAHGVSETTAILPDGWRARLVRYETPATNGVIAWCLEPHDLWVSKAIAGRPKDLSYCRSLIEAGIVDRDVLRERLAAVPALSARAREIVQARIS